MAKLSALVSSLPKFGHAGASIASTRAWNPTLFAAATPRPIQVPTSHQQGSIAPEELKKGQGATETVNVPADQAQDKAFSTAQPFSSNQGASNSNSPFSTTAESLQDKAFSAAQQVSNKTKDAAGQVSATAQNITEKAKQTMQEAWDSTKNTAQKAADTVLGNAHSDKNTIQKAADSVVGKAQESADSVKDKAESVKRSMNTKNKN